MFVIKKVLNQDHHSVWAMKDPHMKKNYSGADGTVGFIAAWQSENPEVGVGEQEIINVLENKRLEFELRFKKPFESTDPAYVTTESVGPEQTIVKWGFKGSMPYPMNIMLLMMNMEVKLAGDLTKGFLNLKTLLEKAKANAGVNGSIDSLNPL